MGYGCDGYITKPIDTRAFPDQITAFLNKKADDTVQHDKKQAASKETKVEE
jgi:DNA-binding response OmpR family regulator